MPSGFLTFKEPVRLLCEGPKEALLSRERALRISAAEAFMAVKAKEKCDHVPGGFY
jgi:hypothetical protein